MRLGSILLAGLLSSSAMAQDAAQQAAQIQQQAVEQQQQILQQQQLSLINQQQLNNAGPDLSGYQIALRVPRLEQRPGADPGTVEVTVTHVPRGASVFYTLDGWTPTAASARYLGPILLHESTDVRAIALTPAGGRSHVTLLEVHLGSPNQPQTASAPTPVHLADLASGTKIPLTFTAEVLSRGKAIGDKLPVSLASNLFVGNTLVAPRGTPATVTVTSVDTSRVQGLPGILSFAARSLTLPDGRVLPLLGVETLEGTNREKKAGVFSVIPLGGLAVHGGDANISAGMRFTAVIADASHTTLSQLAPGMQAPSSAPHDLP